MHVSSRKLPSTGDGKNVPGKVRISSQSHPTRFIAKDLSVGEGDGSILDPNTSALLCLIVVDLGVREGDSCSIDENTTSLPKYIPQQKVPGTTFKGAMEVSSRKRFKYVDPTCVPVFE